MSLICIDIGNSTISIAKSNNGKICKMKKFSSIEEVDFWKYHNSCKKIAISSVVPKLSEKYQKYCIKKLNIEPFIISYKNANISSNVKTISELGNDRICNVISALEKKQFPSIIIDLGTATTFDVINEAGIFIGGSISPGISMLSQSLTKKTAQLPETILKFPKNVIGKNTKTSIQSGVMYGTIDSINGMINRISKELNSNNPNIIITGGYGKIISKMIDIKHIYNPMLTLQGVQSIYLKNNKGIII